MTFSKNIEWRKLVWETYSQGKFKNTQNTAKSFSFVAPITLSTRTGSKSPSSLELLQYFHACTRRFAAHFIHLTPL